MQLIQFLAALEENKIRYIVAGGIAVNLHGIERPTKDLDLIVYLEKKNLMRFVGLMERLEFCPSAPVPAIQFVDSKKRKDWVENKNMLVFSFYHQKNPMMIVDVFVRHPLPFEPMYRRRQKVKVGLMKIPVISIPDLIRLKEKAGRLQDISDIRALKQIVKSMKGKQ